MTKYIIALCLIVLISSCNNSEDLYQSYDSANWRAQNRILKTLKRRKDLSHLTLLMNEQDDYYGYIINTIASVGGTEAFEVLYQRYNYYDSITYTTNDNVYDFYNVLVAIGELGGIDAARIICNGIQTRDYKKSYKALVNRDYFDTSSLYPPITSYEFGSNSAKNSFYYFEGGYEEALLRIGKKSPDILISVLNEFDSDVKSYLISALIVLNEKRISGIMLSMLRDINYETRCFAAQYMGDHGGPDAIDPLIDLLNDSIADVRKDASFALGRVGNSKAVIPIIEYLEERIDSERWGKTESALIDLNRLLSKMETDKETFVIDIELSHKLTPYLTDYQSKFMAFNVLSKLGWEPFNKADSIHFYVANNDKPFLLEHWSDTKRVLLEDIRNADASSYYGFVSLIEIGNEDILPDLIKLLNTEGTQTIAEMFLNCGQNELEKAGARWGSRHGMGVISEDVYYEPDNIKWAQY